MTGELRALGVANGLLLGLLLASPIVAPGLLPWGVEALFVIGGFQLRLADRRGLLRGGLEGWVSHIRMMPMRLIPWAAASVVMLISADGAKAWSVMAAASLGEAMLYPVCALLLFRLSRRAVGVALLVALSARAGMDHETVRYLLAFVSGTIACLFWMRGPDSDAHAMTLTIATMAAAMILLWLVPPLMPLAFQASIICATLTLAHLSVLRRQPVPFRVGGDAVVRRLQLRLPSTPV